MDIDIANALSKKTIVFGLKLWILVCFGIGAIVILILCFFLSWLASKKKKKKRKEITLRRRNPGVVVPVSRSASKQGINSSDGDPRSNALQDINQSRIKRQGDSVSQRLEKALKEHRYNNGLRPIFEEHGRENSLVSGAEMGLTPFFQENRDASVSRQEVLKPNLPENRDENRFLREEFGPIFEDHRDVNGLWNAQGLSPFFGDHRHENGLTQFFQQHSRHENEHYRQEGSRPFHITNPVAMGLFNDHMMAGALGCIVDQGVNDKMNRRNNPMPGLSHLGWGHWYTLTELEIATNSFSCENVIGEGGYGIVFWGRLPDGTRVAVKNLLNNRGQAEREFKREVTAIGRIRHKNLVRLIGYCMEGFKRLLVYEYIGNGNLEQWLHGELGGYPPLSWDSRMKIVLGTAKALAYLHEGLEPKVVHRDIKSSNILLDNNWNPKVADFGLAKLLGTENSHVTTRVMGTFGYVAPEYALSGMLTEKSDVYSYGVLLMEVVTGRTPVDFRRDAGEVNLVEWLKSMVCNHLSEEVLDPTIDVKPVLRTLNQVLAVAIQCVDLDVHRRPKMGQVLHLLEDDDYPFQEMDQKKFIDSLRRNNTPIGTSTSSQTSKSSQIVGSTLLEVATRKNNSSGKWKAPSAEYAMEIQVRDPSYDEG